MVCDAVVMEKVIGVGTAAILNIELTATYGLWLMASLGEEEGGGCRLPNVRGLYQPSRNVRMQTAKPMWLISAISTHSDAGVSQDTKSELELSFN